MTFRGMVFAAALCVGPSCWANDGVPQQLAEVESAALGTLKSLPREWSRSSKRDCRTYEDKNIDSLSPAFAASAAAFLSAFVETHATCDHHLGAQNSRGANLRVRRRERPLRRPAAHNEGQEGKTLRQANHLTPSRRNCSRRTRRLGK